MRVPSSTVTRLRGSSTVRRVPQLREDRRRVVMPSGTMSFFSPYPQEICSPITVTGIPSSSAGMVSVSAGSARSSRLGFTLTISAVPSSRIMYA